MKIASPTFAENAKIPKIYAKLGGNQRPPLEISDVPANTKSLVIICHDPDAPGRDGFYHWTVWNLPSKTTEITGESLPADAVEGITSWGRPGWGGPQPPFGHAPLSILRVRAGHDIRFTRQHQTQRTHRHPHAAHHRPSRADWKIRCVGYCAAGIGCCHNVHKVLYDIDPTKTTSGILTRYLDYLLYNPTNISNLATY